MRSNDLDREFAEIIGGRAADPLGFAVIDLETTGFSTTFDRVVEVAVVQTDERGEVTGEWVSRVDPMRPVAATFIHGIRDEDVRGMPSMAELIPEMVDQLQVRVLAAHNAPFDIGFLKAEFSRQGWRLPDAPWFCTLSASTRYLPHLSRRRLDDCCRAIGMDLDARHAALPDAHAAARLLSWFLDPSRPPEPDPWDLDLPAVAARVEWPTAPNGPVQPEEASPSGPPGRPHFRIRPKQFSPPLMSLLRDYPLDEALGDSAPEGSIPYLEMLLDVLEDGAVTVSEGHALAGLAQLYGLSPGELAQLHRGFLLAMGHLAVADGNVTRQERDEMVEIAVLLGEPEALIPTVLSDARTLAAGKASEGLAPLPNDWSLGEPLRVDDRVVFTGCEETQRSRLEEGARAAGVRVVGGVSGKTALLVSDGSMDGLKAAKARELGTRVVHPDEFEVLLRHVQPAIEARDPGKTRRPRPSTPSPTDVDPSEVRTWARANGYEIGDRGRIRAEIIEAYLQAMGSIDPSTPRGLSQ